MAVPGAEDKGIELASWVGQLGLRRMPKDMESLSAGRRRVFLVVIHHVGEPPVQETWLREHGRLVLQDERGDAVVFEFAPPDHDATFGPRP